MTGAGDARVRGAGQLRSLTEAWEDVQRTRIALAHRGFDRPAAALEAVEEGFGRQIHRELRAQPVWPWLAGYPGLGGVHVARLIALIGDPHRFPGQPCSLGHLVPARYLVGIQCPVLVGDEAAPERCAGILAAERQGTGTRALWHYLGLHVVDGHLPRRKRGTAATWSTAGRTACLQPGGIAEQIVRQRVPVYRDLYDATKARITEERGVGTGTAIDPPAGATLLDGAGNARGIDSEHGLIAPIRVERIARIVAVKAFVGDLLRELKAASTVDYLGVTGDRSDRGAAA